MKVFMLRVLILLVVVMFHGVSYSSEPAEKYFISIKGGVSLGSYESGLNWVLLQYLQEQESKNSKLVSFSGASAGSVNALLSAINYCSRDNSETTESNLLQSSWDIGLPEMFDLGEGETGLLTRKVLKEKLQKIKERVENRLATNDCSIVVSMSVTRMKPYKHTLKKHQEEISLQRFVVPLLVSAKKDEKVTFQNINLEQNKNQCSNERGKLKVPSSYLYLAEENGRLLNIDAVIKLAFASSAFPVAFEPVELGYCFSNYLESNERCDQTKAEYTLFSDGGLFDNSPIGVSQDIAASDQCWLGSKKGGNACAAVGLTDNCNKKVLVEPVKDDSLQYFIYINPDHYRTHGDAEKSAAVDKSKTKIKTGLWDHANYMYDSFTTATEHELRAALIKFSDKDSKSELIITNRYHNLVADFHMHFGAFYAPEFRKHDYLTGVYDGQFTIARHECELSSDKNSEMKCIGDKLSDWINTEMAKQLSPTSGEFVRYLYNTEFKRGEPGKAPKNNILIALSSAFAVASRPENTKQEFYSYLVKLRELLSAEYKRAGLSEKSSLWRIINTYNVWDADNKESIFDNLQNMQKVSGACGDCDNHEMNKNINWLLDLAEPVVTSVFSHSKTGIWPLANNLPYTSTASVSIRYGFDIPEKAQVFSVDTRVKCFHSISCDGDISFHRFGAELGREHYWSGAIGLTYHTSQLKIPTVSLGYERSFAGHSVFKQELDSIYLSTGIVNELFVIKVARRLDDIEKLALSTRADTNFIIMIDVLKIIDFIK